MSTIFKKIFETFGLGVEFSVIFVDGEAKPVYTEKANVAHMRSHIYAHTKQLQDDIYVCIANGGVSVRRTFKNCSAKTVKVKELKARLSGIDFGKQRKDDYFYHLENPRIYETMTFPIDYKRSCEDAANSEFDVTANNRWADPGVVQERIGASPYQPFPAILLSNYQTQKGIVHGSLSQNVFYHNYLTYHKEDGIVLEVYSSFKATEYREVRPNEVLTDEWYLGITDNADNIERIFAEYTSVLREKIPVSYGASRINRDCLVWGSWNDGFFRKISHETLMREARAIVKYFPTVKWLQVDDGYASYNKQAHGLGVPYEGEDGVDCEKFPKGLRAFTDEIKLLGLRPAVWIGGLCPVDTKIYREKPSWFIDYSKRISSASPLDVSVENVREYMKKALDVLISDYGFEGVKHDFWSYAFEDSGDLYSIKSASGYELREWWLQEIRGRLPKDGYLQTGCDIVQANPFLGEYFTNYRYGVDVAEGAWDNMKVNMQWGASCFATHTGDMFVPNSDAVGIFRSLSDREFLFLTTYILITRSCVEISGRFSEISPDEWRLKILQKAVCNPNNGQDVYFLDYDYRKSGRNIPEVWYIKSAHFSCESSKLLPQRTLALFNVDDNEKTVAFESDKLGLNSHDLLLIDVWSGEQFECGRMCQTVLSPHECRLFAICEKGVTHIFDANVKITNVRRLKNGISFETDYGARVELLLAHNVSRVLCDGKETIFETAGKKTCFNIDKKAKIEIYYLS